MHSRFLMLRGAETLDLSGHMFLHDLLESFPAFKEPYHLKEDFRGIYGAQSRMEAEELYNNWNARASGITGYSEFLNMVDNWHEEIFNYFDYGYTNAVTESLNAVCKSSRRYEYLSLYSLDGCRDMLHSCQNTQVQYLDIYRLCRQL